MVGTPWSKARVNLEPAPDVQEPNPLSCMGSEEARQKAIVGMSKTRALPEVLVEIDQCRLIHSVGSMVQPLPNSGF
jgi:hypothetical protein